MTRRRALQVVQRETQLLPRIQELKAEHPCWGDRRLWADLRFVEPPAVNQKRILRLMREPHLLVTPNLKLKAKRTPTRSKPRPTKPHEWWGIDMTQVLVDGFGWSSIVLGLDWYTKTIIGSYVGMQCTAAHWLAALDMAGNRQFLKGAQGQGLSLMSDNGGQPTSAACMQACSTLESPQVFTRDNNPKGKADTERVIRPRQEACIWRQEWSCPFTLIRALESWIVQDNEYDLHSALGDKPPRQFEREDYLSHGTPFTAA
jgi:putative transposase